MHSNHSLRDLLQASFPKLIGQELCNKGYEERFCAAIGARRELGSGKRYWDCTWNGFRLELKKGSVKLDLVRYSEILLELTPESKQPTCLLYLDLDKCGSLNRILGVWTECLIPALGLTTSIARKLLKIKKKVVNRQLYALAIFNLSDLESAKSFVVDDSFLWEDDF